MPSVDRPLAPGVFAEDAQTSIPAIPVPGVSYRDPAHGTDNIGQGWLFQRLVNSAEFNEVMYRITAMLGLVNQTAGLPWSDQVNYQAASATQAPSFVSSTNGHLYIALQPSGSDSGGAKDPAEAGNASYWEQFTGLSSGADVGDVKTVAINTPPLGWLKCDGSAVSRTQYAGLYAAIGDRFGAGDGATTFNLPDLRGEFVRGWDDGRGVDAGRGLGSAQASQNASHTHTGSAAAAGTHSHSGSTSLPGGAHTHTGSVSTAGSHAHTVTSSGGTVRTGYGEQPASASPGSISTGSAGDHSHTVTINGTPVHSHGLSLASDGSHTHVITLNGSGGNESRPRNVALLYVIKY